MRIAGIHIPAWLLLVLIAAASLYPLFFGKFYAVGDMRDVYIPLETFFAQQQRQANLPSWNPDVAWGFPVIAAAQIGFFYPPLLIARFLPISIYLSLILFAHITLLGIGSYYLLRHMRISNLGALLAASSIMLSAFVWQHLVHLNITLALTWFPWQLLLAHTVAKKQKIRASCVAALALALGIPFLIGQLQMPLLIAAITSIYFVFIRHSATKSLRNILRSIAVIGITAMLAFAVAAAQLLPTLELLQYSSRSSNNGFNIERANQHSYPLYHLPTVAFPRFFGNDDSYWGKRLEIEYGFYIGVFPLLIAMITIFQLKKRHIRKKASPQTIFFVTLAIITFLLALGGKSPFRLIGIEPSLWVFSAPARWLFFTTFSLSYLAAVGFDSWHKLKKPLTRTSARLAVITSLAVIGTTVALMNTQIKEFVISGAIEHIPPSIKTLPDEYYREKIQTITHSAAHASISAASPYTLIPLITIITIPLLTHRKRGKQVLATLTIVELVVFAATTTPVTSWANALQEPDTVQQLPEHVRANKARIYSVKRGGDTGAYLTNPESRPDKIVRQRKRNLLVPMIHAQFGISGVEWPASLDLQEQYDVLNNIKKEGSYAVDNIELARELNIGAILSSPDGTNIAIQKLDPKPRVSFMANGASTNNAVKQVHLTPTRQSISVVAPSDGMLIVRDTWFPGWRATVDEVPMNVGTYHSIFRSVHVPKGSHTVTLFYSPIFLYAGMFATVLTIVVCTGVVARYFVFK